MDTSPCRVPLVVGLATLLATALLPRAGVAQHVVEGRVVSASDGFAVEGASIRVVGEDLTIEPDSTGRFRFELPADRPGVALDVEARDHVTVTRTWILPLAESITIVLRRDVVELDPIGVEVDREPKRGWTSRPLEWQLQFRVRRLEGIERTATLRDLRDFPDQTADPWAFLPAMTIATDVGEQGCIMMAGRSCPTLYMDDRKMELDQWRMWRVEEICRVDAVRFPRGGSMILAYTCDFIRDLGAGKRTLSPFIGQSRGGDG